MLKKLSSLQEYEWIYQTFSNAHKQSFGEIPRQTVKWFVPPRFESYIKILHPLDTGDTYKKLAEKFGETYDKTITPGTFEPHLYEKDINLHPELGRKTYSRLVETLAPFTKDPCYFYFSDYDNPVPESLYLGPLQDAVPLFDKNQGTAPIYWWPEDRSWIVHNQAFRSYTIFAGPRALAEKILSADNLEAFEIDENFNMSGGGDFTFKSHFNHIPLERIKDGEPYEWIDRELRAVHLKNYGKTSSLTVENIIPPVYEGYLKIMQPIHKDKYITDETSLYKDCDPDKISLHHGEKMTYKEAAEKYSLVYNKEISMGTFLRQFEDDSLPRYLIFPQDGSLEKDIVKKLLDALHPHTKTTCYFYYDLLSLPGEEMIFRGNLHDVLTLCREDNAGASPKYWWPADRSWVIYTDYDLEYSFIGASKEVIKELSSLSDLETFEVEKDTGISYDADIHLNPGKPNH
ncbi:hypothetical protein EBO34_08610 [Alteribacter keqinensis]|uniref:Uncharacterized protein n=1 Tax=Alteribacter keqinensis TaxID=2483800 RepID=A0A3M7TWI1_9BACI|nr:hypothetical protein EBO34_08610 [Alteribacter keqinensis]